MEEQGKYHVESVASIEAAPNSADRDGFDLILINAALAFGEDTSKFEKIVRLYEEKVLVISDERLTSMAMKVFKMGADYAEKPFEARRVVELVSKRICPSASATSS